jgi:hypothetical protein
MKVICDDCSNYQIHPSMVDHGLPQTCWMYKLKKLDKEYVLNRINGENNKCKEFILL